MSVGINVDNGEVMRILLEYIAELPAGKTTEMFGSNVTGGAKEETEGATIAARGNNRIASRLRGGQRLSRLGQRLVL